MVIQVNKSYKKWAQLVNVVFIENSKLDKHSYLVEYSYQASCLDAQRYPKTVAQDP